MKPGADPAPTDGCSRGTGPASMGITQYFYINSTGDVMASSDLSTECMIPASPTR